MTTQSTRMPGTLTSLGLIEPSATTALDLRNDDAAIVVRGHRLRQNVERQRFLFHAEVAERIGARAHE